MRWTNLFWTALALLVPTAAARAQWSDGFESYADGSPLDGQGGWQGWDGDDTYYSIVSSNLAAEGSQSVVVMAGADSVQPFDGYASGKWELRCEVYVPRAFRGKTYFLLMNAYADGGPYETAVQVVFDGDDGMLECPCGSFMQTEVPLVLGAWAELALVIDLDHDLVEVGYDGAQLASYAWSTGPYGFSSFGELELAAIDLYPNVNSSPHVGEIYFDAFELEPYGGPVGTTYCYGDGTGGICPCLNYAGPGEGCRNSTGSGALLLGLGTTSVGADDLSCSVENLIPGQPALLFSALNAVNNGNGNQFGDGLRCAGGGIVRHGIRIPDANGAASWGPGLSLEGGWVAGDTRRFQSWYRNPVGGPCGLGFNLSNGLEIVFEP